MKNSIVRVPIKGIKYKVKDNTTKCIIHWLNPVTNGVQKSIGISRCNPMDNFDETVGKRLAESRAKRVMWRTYRDFIICIHHKIVVKHRNLCNKEYDHELSIIENL